MPSEEKTSCLPAISHVIFDMDGLLLDSETCYETAYANVVGSFGHRITFDVKIKLSGVPAIQNAEFLVAKYRLPISPDDFVALMAAECARQFSREPIPLMPGADRLVRHLHRHRVPIAIATSTKRANFQLKTAFHADFFSLFSHAVITPEDEEVTRGKPDPQPFLVCARRFKYPPARAASVLVFEDSVAGVKAANAAGMRSVWVPDARTPTDAVVAHLTLASLEDFQPEQFGLPPY